MIKTVITRTLGLLLWALTTIVSRVIWVAIARHTHRFLNDQSVEDVEELQLEQQSLIRPNRSFSDYRLSSSAPNMPVLRLASRASLRSRRPFESNLRLERHRLLSAITRGREGRIDERDFERTKLRELPVDYTSTVHIETLVNQHIETLVNRQLKSRIRKETSWLELALEQT